MPPKKSRPKLIRSIAKQITAFSKTIGKTLRKKFSESVGNREEKLEQINKINKQMARKFEERVRNERDRRGKTTEDVARVRKRINADISKLETLKRQTTEINIEMDNLNETVRDIFDEAEKYGNTSRFQVLAGSLNKLGVSYGVETLAEAYLQNYNAPKLLDLEDVKPQQAQEPQTFFDFNTGSYSQEIIDLDLPQKPMKGFVFEDAPKQLRQSTIDKDDLGFTGVGSHKALTYTLPRTIGMRTKLLFRVMLTQIEDGNVQVLHKAVGQTSLQDFKNTVDRFSGDIEKAQQFLIANVLEEIRKLSESYDTTVCVKQILINDFQFGSPGLQYIRVFKKPPHDLFGSFTTQPIYSENDCLLESMLILDGEIERFEKQMKYSGKGRIEGRRIKSWLSHVENLREALDKKTKKIYSNGRILEAVQGYNRVQNMRTEFRNNRFREEFFNQPYTTEYDNLDAEKEDLEKQIDILRRRGETVSYELEQELKEKKKQLKKSERLLIKKISELDNQLISEGHIRAQKNVAIYNATENTMMYGWSDEQIELFSSVVNKFLREFDESKEDFDEDFPIRLKKTIDQNCGFIYKFNYLFVCGDHCGPSDGQGIIDFIAFSHQNTSIKDERERVDNEDIYFQTPGVYRTSSSNKKPIIQSGMGPLCHVESYFLDCVRKGKLVEFKEKDNRAKELYSMGVVNAQKILKKKEKAYTKHMETKQLIFATYDIEAFRHGENGEQIPYVIVYDISYDDLDYSCGKPLPLEEPNFVYYKKNVRVLGLNCVSEFVSAVIRDLRDVQIEIMSKFQHQIPDEELFCRPELYCIAHNGGKYDHLLTLNTFIDEYEKYPTSFLGESNAIKSCRLPIPDLGSLTFLDTFLMFPSSLDDIATSFLKWEVGKDEFDHDDVNINNYEEKTEECAKYCTRDMKILTSFVHEWVRTLRRAGVNTLPPTASSLSSVLFKLREPNLNLRASPLNIFKVEKEAYFGGYTNTFRTGCYPIKKTVNEKFSEKLQDRIQWNDVKNYDKKNPFIVGYDITSSYPYAMTKDMPYEYISHRVFEKPFTPKLDKIEETDLYILTEFEFKPDFSYPCIMVRDGDHTFLPYKHTGKIPVWGNMLKLALPHLKKVKVDTEIRYSKRPIFREFILECFNKRLEVGKDTPLGSVYKLVMNSFYGGFAQRDYGDSKMISQEELDQILSLSDKHYSKIDFLENSNKCILTSENKTKFYNTSRGMLARFSSFIASEARCTLFRAMFEIPSEYVLYCDTDCIIVRNYGEKKNVFPEKYLAKNKAELGKFCIEKTGDFWLSSAPKFYMLGSLEEHDVEDLKTKYFRSKKIGCKSISKKTKQRDDGIDRGRKVVEQEAFFLHLLEGNVQNICDGKTIFKRKFNQICVNTISPAVRMNFNKTVPEKDGWCRCFRDVEEARKEWERK